MERASMYNHPKAMSLLTFRLGWLQVTDLASATISELQTVLLHSLHTVYISTERQAKGECPWSSSRPPPDLRSGTHSRKSADWWSGLSSSCKKLSFVISIYWWSENTGKYLQMCWSGRSIYWFTPTTRSSLEQSIDLKGLSTTALMHWATELMARPGWST